jgi:predicted N-formylglutamate amidohydrolase
MRSPLVLSCEHGGNAVPARYRGLFRAARRELASHRGWDPGALVLARELAREHGVELHATAVTRLLADANRSLGHPRLFSEFSRRLPAGERRRVLARYWRPHRRSVARAARAGTRSCPSVHLSIHSFTPVLAGRVRTVDVGVLYDPAHAGERRFADVFIAALRAARPDLRVRRNRPYRGTGDGLTTELRAELGARYVGIELEVSQAFPRGSARRWRALRRDLRAALAAALEPWGLGPDPPEGQPPRRALRALRGG